jgi:alcohol dehydrogenase
LLAPATEVNLAALSEREPDGVALKKYAAVAQRLCSPTQTNDAAAHSALVERLANWTRTLQIPTLSHYAIDDAALPKVIANCRAGSMNTNPLVLSDDELRQLLRAAL